MERPEKWWLDEPIELFGVKVQYTEAGCRYYAQHFAQVLDLAIREGKIDHKDIPHARGRVESLLQYIALYERARESAEGGTKEV